jgi:hypothetical protein
MSLLIALTNPASLELFNEFLAVARGLLHDLLDDFFNEKLEFSAKEIFSKERIVYQTLIALDSALVKLQGS